MDRARRWYIYLVSGIGLAALAAGSISLLGTFLAELPFRHSDVLFGESVTRSEISRAIALVVIGLPVWAFHWRLAIRSVQGDDPGARAELTSAIRALYFVIVGLISLAMILTTSVPIVGWVLGASLGVPHAWVPNAASAAAQLLVAGTIWVSHTRRASSDLRITPRSDAGAWLPRLYRYTAAWVTLTIALCGASAAIWTLLAVLVGRGDISDAGWWRPALSSALGLIVVGGFGWWLHWRDAGLAIADAALLGEDERTTHLRAAYVGIVLLQAVLIGCVAMMSAGSTFGRWMLGVNGGSGWNGLMEDILGPLLSVTPFLVAGWLHQRRRVHELLALSPSAVADATRLALRITAFVGLGFLVAGITQLLTLLLELRGGGTSDLLGHGPPREAIAVALGLLVAGLAAWAPAWSSVLRARARDRTGEARATVSAAYLFLVTGAAFVALVPCAVFIVYRLVDTLMGGVVGELAWPLAVTLVAAVVAATHAWLLAVDRYLVADSPVPPVANTAAAHEDRVAIELVLRISGNGDPLEAVERLRAGLGAGSTLDVVGTRRFAALAPTVTPASVFP